MADISVRRAHGMSEDEAKQKVEKVVDDVQEEFSSLVDNIKWNDDKTQANVKGKGFTGQFEVNETDVMIDIDLKLFARPFRGKVEDRINSRMDTYFG